MILLFPKYFRLVYITSWCPAVYLRQQTESGRKMKREIIHIDEENVTVAGLCPQLC